MKLNVTTSPNLKLKGPGIDNVEPELTIGELIKNIVTKYPHLETEGQTIIYIHDKDTFARIYDTDPVNMWYAGDIGDIYRITNSSTMRYRMVVKATPESKSKKEKNNPNKFSKATAETYFKAHNSIIDMLRDRQGLSPEQPSTVDNYRYDKGTVKSHFSSNRLDLLEIKDDAFIVNRRGKRMFVFYLDANDDILLGGKKNAFWDLVQNYTIKAADSFNSNKAVKVKLTPPEPAATTSADAVKFAEYVEIIIVYNNDENATPITSKVPKIPYMQFFSIQSIPMSLPHHVEQPEFHLLIPKNTDERNEIRGMYRIHGMELDHSATIADCSLRSGSHLFFI